MGRKYKLVWKVFMANLFLVVMLYILIFRMRKKTEEITYRVVMNKIMRVVMVVFVVGFMYLLNVYEGSEIEQVSGEGYKEDSLDLEKERENVMRNGVYIDIDELEVVGGNIVIEGTTTLLDGVQITYNIGNYGGTVTVEEGTWQIIESVEEMKSYVDEDVFSDDKTLRENIRVNLFLMGKEVNKKIKLEDKTTLEQEEFVYEVYGDRGENIKEVDGVKVWNEGDPEQEMREVVGKLGEHVGG